MIKLLCAGKLKERCYIEACGELEKRLGRYCRLTVVEVADEKTPERLSGAERARAVEREGERLLAATGERERVVALTIDGKPYDSLAFSQHLMDLIEDSGNAVSFVIGGSLGLSPAVLARADERLSLSALTFPHRIARLLLLEQIYRAFKIARGETYHK